MKIKTKADDEAFFFFYRLARYLDVKIELLKISYIERERSRALIYATLRGRKEEGTPTIVTQGLPYI